MHDKKGQKGKWKSGKRYENANRFIIQPLKRHITQDRKQLESLLYGLRTEFYMDVEKAKRAILEKIQETNHSVELIAHELSRKNGERKDGCSDV